MEKKSPMLCTLTLCLLSLVVFAPYSHAETQLTVQIWGTVVTSEVCPTPWNSPHYVILSKCDGSAKGFGALQISARDTTQGPARVEASDASGADSIKLLNTKIWSTAAPPSNCDAYDLTQDNANYSNCPNIVFSADFDAGPDGAAVTFYRKAKGDLKKSTSGAAGSSFRVNNTVYDGNGGGTIGGPAGKEATTTGFSFNLPATAYKNTSGIRELLGQIWFHLKFANTHVLNLEYVTVENPAGGGTGEIIGDLSIVGQGPTGPETVVCCKTCPEDKAHGGKSKQVACCEPHRSHIFQRSRLTAYPMQLDPFDKDVCVTLYRSSNHEGIIFHSHGC